MSDVLDLLLRFKGFPIDRANAELERLQKMGKDEFLDWQQRKAWSIVRHHYNNNSFYRKKVGAVLPDKWEDLPILTKKDLQRPIKEVIADNININDCYIGSTSGSSGHPFFFAKDKFAHAMTWAVIYNRYKQHGISPSDRQARFYGIPREFVGYWKERVKDLSMNRFRFPVFDLSDEALERFFNQIKKGKFRYLYGYTNSLSLFARYLVKRNIVLKDHCPSVQVCISTSEVCTPEDHTLLQAAFGVKNVREYGGSETCIMAFDNPAGEWQMNEDTLYNELLNDDGSVTGNGETGNIISTSLYNTAFPIIRYQIGDMAIVNARTADSVYRTVDKLMGRTNDTVLLPSGRVAAGFTFYYISRSILESMGVLKEFIIRQTEPNHFIFEVVTDREITVDEKEKIKSTLWRYLEPGLNLTINRVEKIVRPVSGKVKHFYSELKAIEKDSHINTVLPSRNGSSSVAAV